MRPGARHGLIVSLGVLVLAAGAELVAIVSQRAKVRPSEPMAPIRSAAPLEHASVRERFVGSAACTPCHAEQASAFAKSHHANSLMRATANAVAARFGGASFSTALGGTTRFSELSGGALAVTSPNGTGEPQTFAVEYAAGVEPLEQFVVATERGKLQALGVAWDSRATPAGGARWFHVYGDRGVAPGDELFFTRPAQNWNHACADCHSTFVERRYDPNADAFDTRWSELSVGCEACHGPGADHVRRASEHAAGGAYAAALSVRLKPAAAWAPSASGSPTPRATDTTEIEVCAPCHSRREPLHEGFVAGDPFLDAFEPELLRPGRYHADGQVEGEVYEWGSFLQSRMYAAGVRCSDCHEPHAGGLRAEGNALCVRCHDAGRFDAVTHSHHEGDGAPRCIDCHLPPATFMQIDVRRDHSIRVPRPDLSVELGTPSACGNCHAKRSPASLAAAVDAWFPGSVRRPLFASALAAERSGDIDATSALEALALDERAPSIARATALERLGHAPTKQSLAALRASLASHDPLVVYGAVLGVAELPPNERPPLLLSVLDHPRRAVRVAAARALAGMPVTALDGRAREALEHALGEVEEAYALGASRPETLVARSSFELARGRTDVAESLLKTAIERAPCLVEARLNLADLARARADEGAAERAILAALACEPRNAFAHHALGLWRIRSGDKHGALAELTRAVALAPDHTRFAYVLAVATADLGDVPGAVEVLTRALEKNPNERQILELTANYLSALGQKDRATAARARLEHLLAE